MRYNCLAMHLPTRFPLVKTIMGSQSEGFPKVRARPLMLPVAIVVAGGIALANTSASLLTNEDQADMIHNQKPIERAYGWPIAWYWRNYSSQAYPLGWDDYDRPWIGFWRSLKASWRPQSPVSRYSAGHLAADLAIWLVLLIAALACYLWIEARLGPRRWRVRWSTLFVLNLVAVLTALANLSFDALPEHGPGGQRSYGWPLIWCRSIDAATMTLGVREWDYSASRLAGNSAIWLIMLAAAAITWERLLVRFALRFRWSLRTMFAGMALVGAICAWCIAARNRAHEQDTVTEWLGSDLWVHFERWGPKWLNLVGADRYRRRMVAAMVDFRKAGYETEKHAQSFRRLARLSSLRFLEVAADFHDDSVAAVPGMASPLGDMHQLRILIINCACDWSDEPRKNTVREWLVAVGKLGQLERLSLCIGEQSADDLAHIVGLKNLKTLALSVRRSDTGAGGDGNDAEGRPQISALSRLPFLPRLEQLELVDSAVDDDDLEGLAGFPRLKTLDLTGTSITDAGLAKLAAIDSLEELDVDEEIATAVGFESLAALKHLRLVHIAAWPYDDANADLTPLSLDDGQKLGIPSSEFQGTRRAVQALRQSHPEMIIDAGHEFRARNSLEPPWTGPSRDFDSFLRRWGYTR